MDRTAPSDNEIAHIPGGSGEAKPAGHRGIRAPLTGRWFPALSFLSGALCIFIVFRPFFLSHFDSIVSDPGDGRFVIAILEHWLEVFHGRARLASPNFFFPEEGVLGYSEAFLLHAFPYAALRLFGLDRYFAFQGTLMLFIGIGFAGMLWLLRRLLQPGPWLQIAGASLFAISNIYYIQVVHTQLAAVSVVPLLCALAIAYWQAVNRNLARFYIAALGVLLALLLLTSFYIGWFTILASGILLMSVVACSLLCERNASAVRRGTQLLWIRKSELLFGFGAFALAMIPCLALYLPVLGRTKGRSLADALFYMPNLLGALDVGRDNLIWGRLARQIEDVWTPGGVHQHPAGWPVLTLCVFVASAWYFITRLHRSRHSRYSDEKLLLLLLSATSLACIGLWFASVRVHGSLTAWAVVWKFVPGASAIRVPQRISLVLNVGVVLVCVAGLKAFVEAQAGHRARKCVAALLLPFALLVEQVNSMPTHIISRIGEAKRFRKIPAPPKNCSSFFISNEGAGQVNPLLAQTDAMLIARQFDIPTLNGYSGWSPQGWNLWQAAGDETTPAVSWARRKGLDRGLCGLNFTEGRWFPVDPRAHRGLSAIGSEIRPEPIENPGFESKDLSHWATYQSVQIGLSTARAHTGNYSLMETSGEGSIYQDVTGLQPGRVYAIVAWVAASRNATATAQIAAYDPGRNVATFSPAVSPDSIWQSIEHIVTVSPGGTLRVHLFRNQGVGVVYWDDVKIYRVK